jgi:hypothetical protein
MAQDPDRPLDSGAVEMPRTDAGMNRVAPSAQAGGKGSDKDPKMLRSSDQDRRRKDQEILLRAKRRFERCTKSENDNRKAGEDDDKFYAGDQWPSDIVAARNFEKRPVLTINKLPTFIHQVTNDQRQNRPAINISPVGDRSDPQSAKIYRGLIRSIERDSFADIAYDTAFESAARKGWGYWRVVADWSDERSFNQTIRIRRIRNAFSVYLDPDRQEPDGSDARFGFVTEMIPRDDFKDRYPDADPMMWPTGGVGDSNKLWIEQHNVRIAEYYEIENETKTLLMLSNGHVGYEDELSDDVWDKINSNKLEIISEREAEVPKVHWYFLTATQILEERPWPGRYIPIVEVLGEEIDIAGKVRKWGLVRFAKDAQRQYNYWVTTETEHVALSPKAKFLMAFGQDEGFEQEWKTANTQSNPVLHYNQKDAEGQPAPPPIPVPPPPLSQGIVAAKQAAAADMQATTGIRFDATMQERVYDESGRALRELERKGETAWFHLVDNLARALKFTGEILIDLIPKIYDTKQILTILREDDSEELVQLDPHAPKSVGDTRDEFSQKVMKVFNPNVGRYGVTVTIGPSYATKRVEAAESMMDFVRALPQSATLVQDLVAKNQDWPDAEQFAARLASALPPNLLKPEMKDVSPQIQALLGSMQQQLAQLQQEKTAMMQQLLDKQADRAIKADQIEKDFEAKLLNVVMQMETKMAAVQQKAESSVMTHIGSQLKDLAEGVNLLHQTLSQPNGRMQ